MKSFNSKWWLLIFLIDLLAELAAIQGNLQSMRWLTKPLLLLLLIAFVLVQSYSSVKRKWILLAALLFSWMGDLFLLFDSNGSQFFIFGLLSFLTAHIFYIIIFAQLKKLQHPTRKWNPIIFLLLLLYSGSLFLLLYPNLGALKFPVIVYATVLSSMFLVAYHAFDWNKKDGKLILPGALLFVISDSLLALNKFYQAFEYAGLFIMLTYGLAQLLIVAGLTKCMRSANKA